MNHRFVTSLGDPYFAFKAEGVGDLTSLPSFGLIEAYVEFRVEVAPTQSASADELHPLLSFIHDLQTQPAIIELGVTPSGRAKATNRSGGVWQSGSGRILDASQWHSLRVAYDGGTGQWFVDFDTDFQDTSIIDGGGFLVPNAGYSTRLMLFNGNDGLTRAKASIRHAEFAFLGAGGSTILTYGFSGGYGSTLTPEFSGTLPGAMPTSCVLSAGFYDPLFVAPWGSPSSGTPSGSYRWGLTTDYTRLAKPTTTYTRVPA